MIATRSAPVTLVNHDLALDAYLQALLAAVPDDDEAEPSPSPGPPLALLEPTVVVVAATAQPIVVEEPALEAKASSPIGDSEFHALFFRIGEIILATPAMGVRRIVDYGDTTTALPHQPSWLLGLVENQGEKIGVMHTAELILGRESIQGRDFNERPYRQIIIAQNGRYGFACDEVLEMVKLRSEDIRWRTAQPGRRAWLMGAVSKRLCALVDLSELTPIRR